MSAPPWKIWLARHGQTSWSVAGRHTGRSDMPLTPAGEQEARELGVRLKAMTFAAIFTSPLQRSKRTCELAGFGGAAEVMPDLLEWDYGEYEGLTSAEIRARRPGWHLFRDGCPGGEHLGDVIPRADRVVARLKAATGQVLVFSHGHFLRVLSVRWAGIHPESGAHFALASGALCALGWDNHSGDALIDRWNDTGHLTS